MDLGGAKESSEGDEGDPLPRRAYTPRPFCREGGVAGSGYSDATGVTAMALSVVASIVTQASQSFEPSSALL